MTPEALARTRVCRITARCGGVGDRPFHDAVGEHAGRIGRPPDVDHARGHLVGRHVEIGRVLTGEGVGRTIPHQGPTTATASLAQTPNWRYTAQASRRANGALRLKSARVSRTSPAICGTSDMLCSLRREASSLACQEPVPAAWPRWSPPANRACRVPGGGFATAAALWHRPG